MLGRQAWWLVRSSVHYLLDRCHLGYLVYLLLVARVRPPNRYTMAYATQRGGLVTKTTRIRR